MWFLIRVTFWLSIVVMLLPTAPSKAPAESPQVGTLEALSAAGAAVSDLRSFCSRQPEACEVGSQAAVALGHKAQASAKMIFDYLKDKSDAPATDAEKSADVRPGASGPLDKAIHGTLTPADRMPAWRGPAPQTARRPA